MSPKEYLQQIRKLDILIDRKGEEFTWLKEQITRITPVYEKDGSSGGGASQDKLGDTVSKIMDLQNEINADIDKLVDLKREITKKIDEIGNADMIDLLYRRYLRYEKWEKIAVEMNYNIRWVYRLHGQALEKIKTGH